jgi:hypothetical protein
MGKKGAEERRSEGAENAELRRGAGGICRNEPNLMAGATIEPPNEVSDGGYLRRREARRCGRAKHAVNPPRGAVDLRHEPKCGAGATYPATPTRVSREATSDRRAAA